MKDNKVLTIGIIVAVVLVCAAIVLSCIALCGGERKKTASDGNETTAHSISFDSNSGSEVQSIVSESGKPITEPIPEKEGMIFDGWYTSNDGGITLDEKFDFGYMPDGNVQLYAKWKEPTVKRNIYAYSSVEMVWVGNEKETIGMTDEEIIEANEPYLPTKYASIWFDAYTDGVAVLGGFYADEIDPYTAWYKIDDENTLHFYNTKTDMENGTENKSELFGVTYIVSVDCSRIEIHFLNETLESHLVCYFELVSTSLVKD